MQGDDEDDDEEVDEEEIHEDPAAGTDDIIDAMMDNQDQEEVKVQQESPPKNKFDVGFGINVTQQQEDLKRHRSSKNPDLANPSQGDLLDMIGGCNLSDHHNNLFRAS